MRYPGGKGKCFQQLINLMPPHSTYIESHLGGGAVLRNKAPANRSVGIDIDPRVISLWNSRYPGVCELVQDDAHDYLRKVKIDGNELIYADPPYIPSTRRSAKVYAYDYLFDDHKRLLNLLTSIPCMVMVSGYDSDLYNDMLVGWRKICFKAKTHTDVRTEHVWMNFGPPKALHDFSHCGSNFRERQTIKRRQQRLQHRISQMDPIERNELVNWLNSNYGNHPLESI